MLVSGFSFVRNAVKYDYPIVEAISSVLPLVDEFVLALGNSSDTTEEHIRRQLQSPKLTILHTTWDETLKEGGKVLAAETDKALAAVNPASTWCIYIQADECLHEQDYPHIQQAMTHWQHHPEVEALWLHWLHFEGSYNYVSHPFARYDREVRIIRNGLGISSWKDAQGFRLHGKKLHARPANATVYHYGMVKPPGQQKERLRYFHSLWHPEAKAEQLAGGSSEFNYMNTQRLCRFQGKHPAVLQNRIAAHNWPVAGNPENAPLKWSTRLKYLIFKLTGLRVGVYQNFYKLP